MANLSLRHIYKVYYANKKFSFFKKKKQNDFLAVNDFNLEIADGEFIVFVGPSGCGKSTTLRMIAGLEEISGGELYIGDKLVNNVEAMDRDIAMVFQSYALYPDKTVFDNIAFSLRMRKKKETIRLENGETKIVHKKYTKEEITEKVNKVAKMLNIEEYLNRKPSALSGGQCQRVALGRALVRNPKVFLFDEPLSNLDAKLRVTMRKEIVKMHEEIGTTFIYVTHDQVEAMTMGDRIVVLDKGVIQQVDTPMNLFNYPKNKFVARFIGTPPMNMFEVNITFVNEKLVLEFKNGEKISLDTKLMRDIDDKYLDGNTHRVTLGVRSDDIKIKESGLKATLIIKEVLGQSVQLLMNITNENDFVVTATDNFDYEINREYYIRFIESNIHLFDENGNSIMKGERKQ